MKVIKKLTLQNFTCICSIHQPSMEIFELFTQCIILGEGRLLFAGAMEDVVNYFTSELLKFKFTIDVFDYRNAMYSIYHQNKSVFMLPSP